MTHEEQRISLAEACGWREIRPGSDGGHPTGFHPTEARGRVRLPDYLHDLNAVREAENMLTNYQQGIYTDFLRDIVKFAARDDPRWLGPTHFTYAHASAAHKTEAMLKTLGCWKGEVA